MEPVKSFFDKLLAIVKTAYKSESRRKQRPWPYPVDDDDRFDRPVRSRVEARAIIEDELRKQTSTSPSDAWFIRIIDKYEALSAAEDKLRADLADEINMDIIMNNWPRTGYVPLKRTS
jgi:hypothetical protein